jgi:hypothetical protein
MMDLQSAKIMIEKNCLQKAPISSILDLDLNPRWLWGFIKKIR